MLRIPAVSDAILKGTKISKQKYAYVLARYISHLHVKLIQSVKSFLCGEITHKHYFILCTVESLM